MGEHLQASGSALREVIRARSLARLEKTPSFGMTHCENAHCSRTQLNVHQLTKLNVIPRRLACEATRNLLVPSKSRFPFDSFLWSVAQGRLSPLKAVRNDTAFGLGFLKAGFVGWPFAVSKGENVPLPRLEARSARKILNSQ
jgi:hypothetical protein